MKNRFHKNFFRRFLGLIAILSMIQFGGCLGRDYQDNWYKTSSSGKEAEGKLSPQKVAFGSGPVQGFGTGPYRFGTGAFGTGAFGTGPFGTGAFGTGAYRFGTGAFGTGPYRFGTGPNGFATGARGFGSFPKGFGTGPGFRASFPRARFGAFPRGFGTKPNSFPDSNAAKNYGSGGFSTNID